MLPSESPSEGRRASSLGGRRVDRRIVRGGGIVRRVRRRRTGGRRRTAAAALSLFLLGLVDGPSFLCLGLCFLQARAGATDDGVEVLDAGGGAFCARVLMVFVIG